MNKLKPSSLARCILLKVGGIIVFGLFVLSLLGTFSLHVLGATTSNLPFSGVKLEVRNDNIVEQVIAGYADDQHQIAMQIDTYFDIGSLTKAFTAAGILRLSQNGKLHLDDPLEKFLPGLPLEKSQVTLLDLITHRSGLGYPSEEAMKLTLKSHQFESASFFRELIANSPRIGPRFETWQYSNLGYSLLAYILSQSSGQAYKDFITQEFLAPHQIECGFNDGLSVPEERRARGRFQGAESFRAGDDMREQFLQGATGMVCTANGLITWARSILRESVFGDLTRQFLFLQGLPRIGIVEHKPLYSFGWFVENEGSVMHTGETWGFSSVISVNVLDNRIRVELSNQTD